MNKKKKIFLITGISLLVLIAIVGGTYAWYVWTTSDSDTTKIVAGVGAATVTFDGGSDISANLRPVSDKSKGIIKNINVKGDTTGLVFNMYLDITSIDTGLKDESFRYELYKGTTKVKEGNFSDSYLTSNTVTCSKNNTNHIVLLTNESISTSKTSYTLYIWIDGANYTNPNTMMNKTFSFKLHADGEGAVLRGPTAADTITKLYTNALKSTMTNNSITYNTAPSVSLMNDRLGGTIPMKEVKAWESSDTQEHLNNPKSESECLTNFNNIFNCSTNYTAMGFNNQTDCENKYTEDVLNQGRQEICSKSMGEFPDDTAGGNIRYYGANPDNYIYFNCETYPDTNCELWRIIGVFGDKLKLIRNESIGGYGYAKTISGCGWDASVLMKLLNPSTYYSYTDSESGQSLYWNSESGKCYGGGENTTFDCDFSENTSDVRGIKNTTTRNMIAEENWNTGIEVSSDIEGKSYPNDAYVAEEEKTWTGKMGLINISDFLYSLMLSNGKYSDNTWVYQMIGMYSWKNGGYYGGSDGTVRKANGSNPTYVSGLSIFPVLYLTPDISIVGGNGKSDNPYLISK